MLAYAYAFCNVGICSELTLQRRLFDAIEKNTCCRELRLWQHISRRTTGEGALLWVALPRAQTAHHPKYALTSLDACTACRVGMWRPWLTLTRNTAQLASAVVVMRSCAVHHGFLTIMEAALTGHLCVSTRHQASLCASLTHAPAFTLTMLGATKDGVAWTGSTLISVYGHSRSLLTKSGA